MRAKLIATAGAQAGSEFELPAEGSLVLGRAPSCGLILEEEKVSREHCRIGLREGFYCIDDLGSSNGTWVNGERITRAVLCNGDVVGVGDEQFVIELGPETETSGSGLRSADVVYKKEIREKVELQDVSIVMQSLVHGEGEVAIPERVEREVAALIGIIEAVQKNQELEALFEGLMDVVMDVSRADRGCLLVAEKAGTPIKTTVVRFVDTVPPELRGRFSRTLVTECYERALAILRADPFRREDLISPSIVQQDIHSMISVPLPSEQGSVGVIYVDRIGPSAPFTRRDLRILTAMGNEAGIAIHRAQLARRLETLFSGTIQTVVNVVEVKDDYTRGHSERVTEMALLVGGLMGLRRDALRTVRLAGLLHDVGKIGVSSGTLKKPASLTDSEYASMRGHTEMGARVVGAIEGAEAIADAVRHHHERWDGTGYPDRLAGEDIPLAARILAVADTWDAMYADRAYREALPEDECVGEMDGGKGSQFDPDVAGVFVKAFRNDGDFREQVRAIYTRRMDTATA